MTTEAIILHPLVPVRTAPCETAEQCTQLLFGERVRLLDVQERWVKVSVLHYEYTGWADRKMVHPLTPEDLTVLDTDGVQWHVLQTPVALCRLGGENILLPGGCRIPMYNGRPLPLAGKTLELDGADTASWHERPERIVAMARQYLNAPYLWGGNSILGIDCSGFTQTVFATCGIQLPRDASQQAASPHLLPIASPAAAQAGDLAFFANPKGRVTHVGILLGDGHIIHASGCVHIDAIDEQGILSTTTGQYTHRLHGIGRYASDVPDDTQDTPAAAPATRPGNAAKAPLAIVLLFLLIGVATTRNRAHRDYARINGHEQTDAAAAGQYAAAKLRKAGFILAGSLDPLDNLNKARQPRHTSQETLRHLQESISNIYEHIPFKTKPHEESLHPADHALPADSGHIRTDA